MNKMQVWAKILMAILGLYGILVLLRDVWTSFAYLIYQIDSPGLKFTTVNYILFVITILFISLFVCVIYQLLFRGDKWARRLVWDIHGEQNHVEIFWLPASYRLAAFVCGIVIFYWTMPTIIRLFYLWISYFQGEPDYRIHEMPGDSTILTILRLVLSVYLIYGAPHFVRWQVKKALTESKKPTVDSGKTNDI
jgi:hypothetical protein